MHTILKLFLLRSGKDGSIGAMSSPSDADKRTRIQALSDEVKEFHPLLQTLLPKMPRVQDVEYTHGNTELGADFLVTRTDDTFATPEYIGVVAKLGKMDQESISEIERQIDECFIPKRFGSGKFTGQITEVW